MGEEKFANGSVIYRSSEDKPRSCIDALKDHAHYKFSCRCGCGAQFAGYGRDIKAAAKVGFTNNPRPGTPAEQKIATGTPSPSVTGTFVSFLGSSAGPQKVEEPEDPIIDVELDGVEENAEPRRYASDRFVKKAVWGLTDEDIDSYYQENDDPLEKMGVALSDRKPPAIGDLAYSISTGDGPYSVLEHHQKNITLPGGESVRTVCALLRTDRGEIISLPLADLALHRANRPASRRRAWLTPALVVLAYAVMSVLAALFFHTL